MDEKQAEIAREKVYIIIDEAIELLEDFSLVGEEKIKVREILSSARKLKTLMEHYISE